MDAIERIEELLLESLSKLDTLTADIATLRIDMAKLRTGQLQTAKAYSQQSSGIQFLLTEQAATKELVNSSRDESNARLDVMTELLVNKKAP